MLSSPLIATNPANFTVTKGLPVISPFPGFAEAGG